MPNYWDEKIKERQREQFSETEYRRAVMGRWQCHICGSTDGMPSIDAQSLSSFFQYYPKEPVIWYRYEDKPGVLYYCCDNCNSVNAVPEDFTPLSPQQVQDWIAAQLKGGSK